LCLAPFSPGALSSGGCCVPPLFSPPPHLASGRARCSFSVRCLVPLFCRFGAVWLAVRGQAHGCSLLVLLLAGFSLLSCPALGFRLSFLCLACVLSLRCRFCFRCLFDSAFCYCPDSVTELACFCRCLVPLLCRFGTVWLAVRGQAHGCSFLCSFASRFQSFAVSCFGL